MVGTLVFGVGILIVLVGVGFLIFASKSGETGAGLGGLAITIVIGGAMIVGPCVGVVDTKKVGVVTSYKKPTGEIKQAGAYLTAPWKSVTEMDAAKQTEPYDVSVQLAGGATATITVYPNWEMDPKAAPELFQQFKSFPEVIKSVWEQQLKTTANEIFSTYNPLNNVDPATGELKKTKAAWAAELKVALQANPLIKGNLIINSVTIPTIAPDPGTQDNLNKIVAEFAKGKILDQQRVNADKQKLITETNAKVDKATRCLEIAQATNKDPGTCALFEKGNSSGVILSTGGSATK